LYTKDGKECHTYRSVMTSVDFVWYFALKKMTHSFFVGQINWLG